jgi:hypothetical protein
MHRNILRVHPESVVAEHDEISRAINSKSTVADFDPTALFNLYTFIQLKIKFLFSIMTVMDPVRSRGRKNYKINLSSHGLTATCF